jgi:two-component system, OmpR family, sensor histidine kinase KdpD
MINTPPPVTLRRRLSRAFDRILGIDRALPVRRGVLLAQYVWAFLVIALCTEISRIMVGAPYFGLDNVVMVYMLGIVLSAIRYGPGPAMLAAVLAVVAINIFFLPHSEFTLSAGAQNLVTLGAMLSIAAVISVLALRARQQTELARRREQRTAALNAMSADLASAADVDDIARAAVQHIGDEFDSRVAVLLPGTGEKLLIIGDDAIVSGMDMPAQRIAEWALEHRQWAGRNTTHEPQADTLYVPLIASRGAVGVLCLRPAAYDRALSTEQIALLQTFTNQTALAVERAQMAEEAGQAQVQVQTEQLRNALLSSVSHDLRTPLTAISGASSALLEGEGVLDSTTRRDLTQTISDEADRLNRLVRNLLDMTRLESGSVLVRKEWQLIDEVIGAALARAEPQLAGRTVTTDLPADLPPAPLDGALIEQVLINLLENAAKYTPQGSAIDIRAHADASELVVEVNDHGPGLPPGDEERIFEKFYRASGQRAEGSGAERGSGLGLTICRGMVQAHGGRIWATNRADGGATFAFALPLTVTS